MQVSLIGKNSINRINLPRNPLGNYCFSSKTTSEENIAIYIDGINRNWQITSNNYVKIVDPTSLIITDNNIEINQENKKFLDKIILKENGMYAICLGNMEEVFILYCAPICDDSFIHLNIINTNEITIGSSKDSMIFYNNSIVAHTHSKIFRENGNWFVQNYDQKFGTFLNNSPIFDEKKILYNGDVVFIMGLKVILINNNLYINQPKGKVIYNKRYFTLNNIAGIIKYSKRNEINSDEEIELYKNRDYFSRAPRITNLIETEKIRIDEPPQMQDRQEMPILLVLGSSLSMGVVMAISVITTIQSRNDGTGASKQAIISIITACIMLVSMVLIPILNIKYDKKQKKKYEEKRQKKYKEYLKSKRDLINKNINKQRDILFENFLSVEQCQDIILNKKPRLWERKIDDYDFLAVRLGIGEVPLKIDIQYPQEQFALEEDDLRDILHSMVENSRAIQGAPITTSLVEKNISAIISKDEKIVDKFIKNIILQLITFHSYEDLKLVFLVKNNNQKKWDFVKMLPHIWDDSKKIRYFADDYDDMKEIARNLENDLRERQNDEEPNYKKYSPYYLIITDDYKKIENLRVINEILKTKENIGFSLLCLTEDLTQLPNECKTFINLENGKGMLFDNEISSNNQKRIVLDDVPQIKFTKLNKILANIPIRYKKSGNYGLPSKFSFLEMYNVGRIEQLNIWERWNKNDSTISLKAPVGIDNSGMPIILDIHEKYHGPHGLIAGSTGSGKSEFIITYILSLALNYHPDDLTFLLIDYKGGGLAGAFEKNNIKLPHLVGTITNIDTNGLQRSLTSIQSELRRRQVIFNNVRNIVDEGTIDIYKYQRLYHEGVVDEPIPHLLIICDEFAELKQQQHDFMDELISVSRIGRSLGVHLILATQKPAGIVDEQIRSNSKFAVCLKVQDMEDSYDVIRKADAASLKRAGQFYLQVGNDELFTLGQSAWTGAPYYPADTVKKKIDNSLEIISNIGIPIKKVDNSKQQTIKNEGEQLTNILKYIYTIAKEEHIKTHNLWLEDIPEIIYIDELKEKYNVLNNEDQIEAVIGEYDDPSNQEQGLVKINFLNKENIIIYGNAESGKETLLSTMIFNLITSYTTNQIQLYILDFGSEALKIYKNSPHVGDVVFLNEEEKVSRCFDMIQREIRKRKSILSNYNGDYNLYIKSNRNKMPIITIILNNYAAFAENYDDKYDEIFVMLTREGLKCGINFVVTANAFNEMRYRLAQNFNKKIGLQLNNEDDYYNIFDNVGKKRPTHVFGRGLVEIDNKEVFEFQTAKICEDIDYNTYIESTINRLNESNKLAAEEIPTIPRKINLEDVEEYLKDISNVPIGITTKELQLQTYDFRKNFMTIISSKNMEYAVEFGTYVTELVKELNNVDVIILDADESIMKKNFKKSYYDFEKQVSEIENKQDDKILLCVIIGIDKILNHAEIDEYKFTKLLKEAEENEKCRFIIIENPNRLKNHQYEEWYKNYITNESGIWIGNGIEDQFLIRITSRRERLPNNCGSSYGFVIQDGNANMIKLIGMKEDDENE